MVPQRHAVPKHMPVGMRCTLLVPVFIDDILDSVDFTPTVISVNKDVLPPVSLLRLLDLECKTFHHLDTF